VYVINRDLVQDISAYIMITGTDLTIQSVTVETLNGPGYESVNTHEDPDAVTLTTSSLTPSDIFNITFPAHSLTRLTLEFAPGSS
jgi:alpha-L-arabinofuranosidase